MEEQNSTDISVSDCLSYHQTLIDDIKFAKGQQWRLAYYILLLEGAIIGIFKALPKRTAITIVLFTTVLVVSAFGTLFLFKFQKDLTRYRGNIKKIRANFPEELKKISAYEPAEGDSTYYAGFLVFIVSVIWVGFVFVGWIIGFWNLIFCT
jgi:hypothetical protein